MRYFLWSRDSLLGAVSAIPGAPGPGVTGFFHPTAEFRTVGAPLAELGEEAPRLVTTANVAWPPAPADPAGREEYARAVQAAIRASPEWMRLVELHHAVAALALELRDEDGGVVPAQTIAVQRLPDVLAADLAEAANEAEAEMSALILVAPLAPGVPPS